jgi:hypothetical protein
MMNAWPVVGPRPRDHESPFGTGTGARVRDDIFALFKCSFLKIALGAIRPAPISLYLGVIAFAGADPALSSSSHTLKALIAASASARLI